MAQWYRHAHSGITGRTEQLLKNMLHAYLPGSVYNAIHKATVLTVPGRSMICLVQGRGHQLQGKGDGEVTEEHAARLSTGLECLQRYSQSHQPHCSRPLHDLPGTIPLLYCSIPEAINGGTISGGCSYQWLFWGQPVTKELATL